MSLCLYLSAFASLPLSLYLCLSAFASLPLSLCLCLSLSLLVSVSLFLCLSVQPQFPASMRLILSDIRDAVASKFPDSAISSVGGFVFLRFLGAAIAAPEVRVPSAHAYVFIYGWVWVFGWVGVGGRERV